MFGVKCWILICTCLRKPSRISSFNPELWGSDRRELSSDEHSEERP